MTAMRLNKLQILIILLLLVSFLFRILPIFTSQIFFWFDQGLDIVLTRQLVIDGDITLTGRYSGLAGVLMGPLWTWVLAIPFVLSGGNPNANVVFFSLVCIVSIVLTYFFLKKFINPHSAVFVFVFLCFAPIYTYGSQIVASPHPLIFLFVFFIWFCYQIYALNKTLYFVPLGLLIGVFFQLEIGFAIFTFPVLVLLTLAFKRHKIIIDKFFYLGILVLGLTFLPQLFFDLRHDFLISSSLLNFLTGKSQSLYGTSAPLPERFLSRLGSFREDFIGFALFIEPMVLKLFLLAISLIGWFLIIKNRLTREINLAKILLITLLGFFIGFTLYPGPLWTWYRSGLPIVYILLLVIPIGIVWRKIKLLGFLSLILVVISIYQALNMGGVSDTDNANLKNQLAAIDYVYKNANGRPFSYYIYTPPVYDYVWQHHFYWYGQKKYDYMPKNHQVGVPLLGTGPDKKPPSKNEGLFYLIMEPDKERPWQIDGWKKTFIKVGKVQKTSNFPGDIVVEERSTE